MDERSALVELLREETTTPEACWFCLWDGSGVEDRGVSARVAWLGRNHLLYRGPIEMALASVLGPVSQQSPHLWWPDDRAWIVATDVDFDSTYVGGTPRSIERLSTDSRLEVLPALLSDVVVTLGDQINAELDGASAT